MLELELQCGLGFNVGTRLRVGARASARTRVRVGVRGSAVCVEAKVEVKCKG